MRLEDEDFDLEAWKSSTTSMLTKIFGPSDPKIKQVDQLKIDYSSWMLRDSNAHYKPTETAKKKGKEILKTAIDEVEIFGAGENPASLVLGKELEEELKNMSDKERKKHFSSMKKEKLVDLLIKLTQ